MLLPPISFIKRNMLLLLILGLITGSTYAQTAISGLQKADSLVQNGKDSAAIQIYKRILQKDSLQKQALANLSILLMRQGERQKKAKDAKALYAQALQLSRSALHTAPNFVPAVYAYSLALYNHSMQQGVKDKIQGLRDVKDYLDRILMLDSAYAKVWYLSGRWNMAFSQLNFAERAAVKLLFGGMPKAGAEEAVNCYLQCKNLSPSFIRNYYYMAQAQHAEGRDLQAIATLKEAIHLRPILKDDRAFQQKCKAFIEALQ